MSKRLLLIIIILLLAVAALLMLTRVEPPTTEEAATLLSRTLTADELCFELNATILANGVERNYFTLIGEKTATACHVAGEVLGSPCELYFIDNTLYQMLDGEWRKHELNGIDQATSLFAELTPAGSLAPAQVTDCTYLGQQKTEQGEKMLLEITAEPAGWIADYFTNTTWQVLCDRRGRRVESVTISAVSRADPASSLQMQASFTQPGGNLLITAPQ